MRDWIRWSTCRALSNSNPTTISRRRWSRSGRRTPSSPSCSSTGIRLSVILNTHPLRPSLTTTIYKDNSSLRSVTSSSSPASPSSNSKSSMPSSCCTTRPPITSSPGRVNGGSSKIANYFHWSPSKGSLKSLEHTSICTSWASATCVWTQVRRTINSKWLLSFWKSSQSRARYKRK